MFYELEVKGHVRVPPTLFSEQTSQSVMKSLTKHFDGFISKELGVIMGVSELLTVGEGIIIPGDGAAYYDSTFKILAFKPDIQDVTVGKITDIAEFGAFMTIGPIDGMMHISQTMDDFVSFNKSNVLTGKDSKRTLKVGDICRARVISVSYKDIANPKIGLTMRQHRLGALPWIEAELKKEAKAGKGEKDE